MSALESVNPTCKNCNLSSPLALGWVKCSFHKLTCRVSASCPDFIVKNYKSQ